MTTITNKTHKTKSTMFIRKYMAQSAFVMLCLFMIGLNATAQEGQFIRETVHSPSLEGNLLGDSPDRPVNIYLPPSYDTEPGRRYPVVYLLHGFTSNHNAWTGGSHGSILNTMKSWLEQGRVKEMIIVMPNSYNKFRGSFYTNSSATGNWADYIAKDLVEYIDSYYRTLPQRESRAIIGHSMGGYGAVKLGILYYEIFGCMGGLAGAYMIEELELQARASSYAYASTVEDWSQFYSLGWLQQTSFAFSAALAPNPDRPPFYCDFPYVYTDTIPREVIKVQEVYDKFLEQDILRLTEKHRDALLSMKAIYIDCGKSDGLIERSRQLHEKLEGFGVEHFYKEFFGGHTSRVMISTGDALELFSSAITFEMLAGELPTNLVPADGAMYPDTWVSLSWMAGQTAVSHDVYFGDNFDDVNNSTGGTFRGNQTETSFTVGLPGSPYPDGLVPGTTYYWRIDEVNGPPDYTVYEGSVWSFTVSEPGLVGYWKLDETEGNIAHDSAGAHDGILNGEPLWQPVGGQIDGALAFDGTDDYVSTPFILDPAAGAFSVFAWIKEGAPGQVIISQADRTIFDITLSPGSAWLSTDPAEGKLMTELQGPGQTGGPLASQTVVTDGGWHRVGLTWDSSNRILYVDDVEVTRYTRDTQPQFGSSREGLYIGAGNNLEPGSFFSGLIDDVRVYDRAITKVAAEPNPANGAENVSIDTTLTWRPGLCAATHDVYFGTSSPPAFIGTQAANRFDPGSLEFNTTYYWQVDEFDGTATYKGDVWSFNVLSAPGLVGLWKLDEAEGFIAQDSSGENDGTLYGEPLWQPTGGQIDGALAFDGIDDYVSTDFVLNPADGPFSVFAWIKEGAPGQVVLSQIGGANWLCTDLSEGKLMTELKTLGRGRGPIVSQFVITDGQWHRIGFVWDGSYRYLYVDGAEVAKDTKSSNILESSDGGLYLGAGKNLDAASFFSGLIDDVRIYDRAVTP